jgi:signal transduction histidine kinase
MIGVMVGNPVNLSHEFRTLVASIREPLEAELADRALLPGPRRERTKTLHRNVMRLLQMVNTLFDLPVADPGRRATYDSVDLAATTVILPLVRDRERAAPREQPRRERRGTAPSTGELERANQELEAFSYSVSHDLRGPLRAIHGFSRILISDHGHTLDREGRDLLEQIHGSAQRMSAIVEDLLALSRAGREPLRREAIDLTAIARRIVSDLRRRESSHNVEVCVAEGLTASGDSRLVTLALENLLANAWKFTSKRSCAQVIFDREDRGVFALRDNGAGFDMTRSERLFEPFHRLHTSNEFEGNGIGLAIVRRVIERHGGRVWAEGAVDRGATIRFTLQPRTS